MTRDLLIVRVSVTRTAIHAKVGDTLPMVIKKNKFFRSARRNLLSEKCEMFQYDSNDWSGEIYYV